MRIGYLKVFIVFFLTLDFFSKPLAQNIVIRDTVKSNLPFSKFDSLFTVEGEVLGMDSGSLKVSSAMSGLLAYVPFKYGKFYFTGSVKTLEQLRISIKGDYYDNVFYVEPGEIKVKYIYHGKFTASGTTENDLSNYFLDTLNKKNSERFWELSSKVEGALKNENLDLYLRLIDSFKVVENSFFKTLDYAIDQKRFGDYLLAYVNYYYINYGYFAERKAIYDRLPDNIKNSPSGKRALEYLEKTQKKNASLGNIQAYEFTLKDVSNKPVALRNFRGKTIVLDFWASWCLPCIKALPLLKKVQANSLSKNVVYISVSIDKKKDDWLLRDKNLKILWRSLLADELTIKNYDVAAVPSYIVINNEGKIAGKSSSLSNLYITLRDMKK